MISAPIRVPSTVPSPPIRLVPPMTVAAIASSSYIMPAMGCAEFSRAVSRIAASPLSSPASAVDQRLVEADVDAREPRRLFVAADRVGVATELRAPQNEVRDDVDRDHDDDRRGDAQPPRPSRTQRKVSLKPEIGRPSVNIRAAPRATLIMPSVAMKGGSRPTVMSSPLTSAACETDAEATPRAPAAKAGRAEARSP